MSGNLTLSGALRVGGDCVTACGGASDQVVYQLALQCASSQYQSVVDVPVPLSIVGTIGTDYVDLDVLNDLIAIEFLYLKSSGDIIARIGAGPATLTGVGGTFATILVGETLNITIDGTPIAVVFTGTDITAALCVARINAACALAGLATPRAVVVASTGQIQITGLATGPQGTLAITSGTATVKLGFTNGQTAVGTGADVRFAGTLMIELSRYPNAPTRVQLSGTAQVKVLAAGRTS